MTPVSGINADTLRELEALRAMRRRILAACEQAEAVTLPEEVRFTVTDLRAFLGDPPSAQPDDGSDRPGPCPGCRSDDTAWQNGDDDRAYCNGCLREWWEGQ